ncbi:hypothetical protein [Leifsonia sp. NPDC058230]|uniref:hypothetical protein n=1 Tax=Leifsonia sp. NPDC058230 TaxID=3346391 RepID=UPI0036DC5B50
MSTSSLAFQAILDDLVRTVGEAEALVPSSVPEAEAGPNTGPEAEALPGNRDPQEGGRNTPHQDFRDDVLRPLILPAVQRPPRAPALLRGRGDLTLVVGLGADAVAAARMLAEAIGDAEVRPGGCARAAAPRVDDRRGALRARADGVRRERTIVAAFGIARGASEIPELAESLAGIEPDQVWLAVDASRKVDDTAAWVKAVDAILGADGLTVTNAALTATPDSVRELGLPIGWVDGTPAGIG